MASSLAKKVAAILTDSTANRYMNYEVCGIRVTPKMLKDIGDAILAGQISISYDTRYSSAYNPSTNILRVHSKTLSGAADKAVVVHEGVHALNDSRAMDLVRINDEAAAYVAHGIYLRCHDSRFVGGGTYVSDGSIEDNMREIMIKIADSVIAGGSPSKADIETLKDRIVCLSGYEDSRDTIIHHNGLKKV